MWQAGHKSHGFYPSQDTLRAAIPLQPPTNHFLLNASYILSHFILHQHCSSLFSENLAAYSKKLIEAGLNISGQLKVCMAA